ncbi:hypothetical protein CVT25_007235 [Psilocybe cyanescens]|uniref:DUF6533 domain-containing protein n=1 Tax=Psilocybe cyanescens TaxID=93625 RepID=A0A409XVT3_PSICY|nr:hypothetical protein CVT25_007235 [Psilocybe cyanescens]
MDDVLSLNQDLLQNITIRKWSTLASWAVLLYEYVITLSEEIRHIWSTEIGTDAICGNRAVNVPYTKICDASRTHPYVLYYCISVWITHISLGVLTALKYNLVRMNIPVVRVVTRDGAWITIIVCSLFTTVAPWALIQQVTKAHVVFGWPITIISICCCRMIMNMQKLDITETTVDPENLTELISELHTLQLELKG